MENETREEFHKKKAKEIMEDFSFLDEEKMYSAEEIKQILEEKRYNGGIYVFTPEKPYRGIDIIASVLLRAITIADALDKSMGLYSDSIYCPKCEGYKRPETEVDGYSCHCHDTDK